MQTGNYNHNRSCMLRAHKLRCWVAFPNFITAFIPNQIFCWNRYSSAGIYKRAGGQDWKRVMIVTGLLFPGLVFCLLFLLNIIAMVYQSRAQVAITTMVWAFQRIFFHKADSDFEQLYMFCIWLIVSCPLLLFGQFLLLCLQRNF